jgi:hypothetical protein
VFVNEAGASSISDVIRGGSVLLNGMTDAGTNTTPAWLPILTALLPILTLILGFVTASITEWFRDGRAIRREREAREDTSRAQRFERRTNFQRETLLNLQDSVAKLARVTGKMHHFDLMEYRKTGKRGSLFPDEFSDESQKANVSITLLTSRVRDDGIRKLAEMFREAANWVPLCPSEEDAKAAVGKMAETLDALYKRTGEALRKLDDDEDATSP